MSTRIRTHKDLQVYQEAFAAATRIYDLTKTFPRSEHYALTDQVRRSSRSVCANLAEAWRKRRYAKAFISKLCDGEGEAAETQVWLDFAGAHGYLSQETVAELNQTYDHILRVLVTMINQPEKWVIGQDS